MIKLKNLLLKTKVIQSPMAGCTDLAFRLIARSFGMELAFLEMISSRALAYKNAKTFKLFETTDEDKPIGAQIVGSDPKMMANAAALIEDKGFDVLDINLGCPVPKITRSGWGSALLTEPDKAKEVFISVLKAVKHIPITVKMRKGYADPSGEEAIRMAKIAQDCGISALTVHGRTRKQLYSGTADWEIIRLVKQSVKIPVFGNGDILTGEDAKRMIETTGCDGIMIARGALGNPWIYKEIEAVLNGSSFSNKPSLEEKRKIVLKHLNLELESHGQQSGFLRSKKMVCWYFKDYPRSAEFRNFINRTPSPEEMKTIIQSFSFE